MIETSRRPLMTIDPRVVRCRCCSALGITVLLLAASMGRAPADEQPQAGGAAQAGDASDDGRKWTALFDGKTLEGWKITKFGGEGDVSVENDRIILGFGNDLTGIHTDRKLPKINYEVELEAMRVDGSDFFCGFTFPVKDDPCSLIVGGWGGGVIGLSSLDRLDASENETTTYREFKNGTWYKIRLRVMDQRIQAWIDGKEMIDVDTTNRKISIRYELDPSQPFGFATWQTTGALRGIRIRELTEEELKAAPREE